MFCCTLLYVHSSIAIIFTEKRELVALLNLSSWCLVVVERLFLEVPWGCLWFVIVVLSDHTHLLFLVEVHKVMLHTKYQGSSPYGFRQEYFFMCSLYSRLKQVTPVAGHLFGTRVMI